MRIRIILALAFIAMFVLTCLNTCAVRNLSEKIDALSEKDSVVIPVEEVIVRHQQPILIPHVQTTRPVIE